MHSNAQQCTPHHSTLAFDRQQHRTYTTSQHSTAQDAAAQHGAHGAHGALAALGAVLPRATDAPRYGQQGMPDRTKAGPRLLSFIFVGVTVFSQTVSHRGVPRVSPALPHLRTVG